MYMHDINVHSRDDCQELIDRIRGTLADVRPGALTDIRNYPGPFIQNDADIFGWLPPAILSSGTKYYLLAPHLPAIRRILLNYNIVGIANLSDNDIDSNLLPQIQQLRIPSKIKIQTKLRWIRDSAKTFMQIQMSHAHVWQFLETELGESRFNHTRGCYIHPNDDRLIRDLTAPGSGHKLRGVGLAICCEFFNNIGLDEFKPDVHTISLLNRINLDRSPSIGKVDVSRKPASVRSIGITIAQTLDKARAYVDSLMWVFCAEGEGDVCTEDDPKCESCWLKAKESAFCKGFPNKTEIRTNPVGAANRLKECNLTRNEAGQKMAKARLTPATIERALTAVYGS